MDIGVVEYFSATAPHLDDDLLLQGYAMLESAVKDFAALGTSVKTILDYRVKPEPLSAEVVWCYEEDDFKHKLASLSKNVDYLLLIAPEHLLPSLLEELDSDKLLNSTPESIREVSDKCRLAKRLAQIGLDVPESRCFEGRVDAEALKSASKEIGYPAAIKPTIAAGCEGLSVVYGEEELEAAYAKACRSDPSGSVIIQRWYEGVPASVSLIVSEHKIQPLSLNRQIIKIGAPKENSAYLGGVVPLPHHLSREALTAASKAVAAFSGLRGYVGVDLVLTDRKPIVLEINPRLTVSYVGLSRVLEGGVARMMVNEVYMKTDQKPVFKGFASFLKASLPTGCKVEGAEVIRSPIRGGSGRCFILVQGVSYLDSLSRLKGVVSGCSAEVDVDFADLGA
jgi:predicted ATP-grasp superfamily ATP-dependent carboligase